MPSRIVLLTLLATSFKLLHMAYPKGFKSVRFGKTYINITALARELEMDPSYLSCALKGDKQLTVPKLTALAKKLKMTQEAVLDAIEQRREISLPRRRFTA